jgi:hypothetical protein
MAPSLFKGDSFLSERVNMNRLRESSRGSDQQLLRHSSDLEGNLWNNVSRLLNDVISLRSDPLLTINMLSSHSLARSLYDY